MVDWTSKDSLEKQGIILSKLDLILFGIFLWESVVTLWFDIEVVIRKRPFRWPVLVYWLTKYCTLAFIIGVNIIDGAAGFLVTPHFIHCQATQYIITLSARCAMAGASALLMLRAIALWNRDYRVAVPLIALHLAQWGFYLYNAFTIPEAWSEELQMCYTTKVSIGWLKAQFIYTMVFDGAVLLAASWALAQLPGRTSLWKLLFLDGLVYYVGAFLMYFACTLVAHLNPSPYFMFTFSDVATVGVSILACRSFVRIATCKPEDGSTWERPSPTGTGVIFDKAPSTTFGGALSGLWKTTFNRKENLGSRTNIGTTNDRRSIAVLEMSHVSLQTLELSINESDMETQSQKA